MELANLSYEAFKTDKIKNADFIKMMFKNLEDKNLKTIAKSIQTLVKCFFLTLSDQTLVTKINKPRNLQLEKEKVSVWLCDRYNEFHDTLIKIFSSNKDRKLKKLALVNALTLMKAEAKHPIQAKNYPQFLFPNNYLEKWLDILISNDAYNKTVIESFASQLDEELVLKYHTLKILYRLSREDKNQNNVVFTCNFFCLLEKIVLPSNIELPNDEETEEDYDEQSDSSDEDMDTDDDDNDDEMEDEDTLSDEQNLFAETRKVFSETWSELLNQNISYEIHKKCLVLLPKNVFQHVESPFSYCGMFMNAFTQGGELGVIALEGLLVLMWKHNVEYPDFHGRLYELLETALSHEDKWKFFYLTYRCLLYPLIEESVIIGFTKRCSRLLLTGISIPSMILLLRFISNMFLEFHYLKKMVQNSEYDPYCETASLEECQASKSTLWELRLMCKHMDPVVAREARFVLNRPEKQWNLQEPVEDLALKLKS